MKSKSPILDGAIAKIIGAGFSHGFSMRMPDGKLRRFACCEYHDDQSYEVVYEFAGATFFLVHLDSRDNGRGEIGREEIQASTLATLGYHDSEHGDWEAVGSMLEKQIAVIEPYTDDPSVTAFYLAHGGKVTASKAVEAVQPLKPELDETFLHGDGGWRFATSPSSGSQAFRLLAGECLIAEVSPCPTFGSGWSDEQILSLIEASPALLAAAKTLIAGCEAHLAAQGYALQISGMIATRAAIARAEKGVS